VLDAHLPTVAGLTVIGALGYAATVWRLRGVLQLDVLARVRRPA
jgi:hypothetical protein